MENSIDKRIKWVIDVFASKTIIMVVMLLFMAGIIHHLQAVFDSWLLAIGVQFTILLMSINAEYMPSIKSESGADIPILAILVAICIAYLLYMYMDGIDNAPLWSPKHILTIVKAVFIAALELSYSFLFVAKTQNKQEKPKYQSTYERLKAQHNSTIHNEPVQTTVKRENESSKEFVVEPEKKSFKNISIS